MVSFLGFSFEVIIIYIYIFFLLFSIGSQRQRPQQQQEGSESGACVLRWQRFSASSRGATSVVPVTWTYERNKKKAERGKKHRQRKAAGTKLAAESWSQHTHTHTQAAIWELKTLARRIQWKVSHAAVGYLQPSDSLCSFRPLTLSILTHENKQQAQFFSASIGSSYWGGSCGCP